MFTKKGSKKELDVTKSDRWRKKSLELFIYGEIVVLTFIKRFASEDCHLLFPIIE